MVRIKSKRLNVLLNTDCNLNCGYCFAEKTKKNRIQMTKENFLFVLNYFVKNKIDTIRLAGGEPTLNNDFCEIIEILKNNKNINKCFFYTNLLADDKKIESIIKLNEKKIVSLLVNINSVYDIGKEKYNKILNNLEKLKQHKIDFNLSVNIYNKNFDFHYAIELAKRFSAHLRFSYTTPLNYKKIDIEDYLKTGAKIVIDFVKRAYKENISFGSDCNKIPACCYTEKQIEILREQAPSVLSRPLCTLPTTLSIRPDLKLIPCFVLEKYYCEELKMEKPYEYYYEDIIEKIKPKLKDNLFDKCENCELKRYFGQSCACLIYRCG